MTAADNAPHHAHFDGAFLLDYRERMMVWAYSSTHKITVQMIIPKTVPFIMPLAAASLLLSSRSPAIIPLPHTDLPNNCPGFGWGFLFGLALALRVY